MNNTLVPYYERIIAIDGEELVLGKSAIALHKKGVLEFVGVTEKTVIYRLAKGHNTDSFNRALVQVTNRDF